MSIADELITRGWFQGDWMDGDGRVCLGGAAVCAAGSWMPEVACPQNMPERELMAIARIIAAPVDPTWFVDDIARWNDKPGRTFDEVLRVAKEADAILDAQ